MDTKGLIYQIETHPYVVALVLFVGLLFFFNFIKKGTTTTPVASVPGGTTPQTSDTINNYYNQYPVAPTPPVPVGVNPGPTGTPIPVTLTTHLIVRQASTIDIQKKLHTVPVKAKTDHTSATVKSLPYGSSIVATGSAVIGGYNYPLSGGNGSNMWYPVSGGFLNAYDVSSVTTS